MDNLFNFYKAKVLAHGVAQTNGHGLPEAIKQKEEMMNVKVAEQLWETTRATRGGGGQFRFGGSGWQKQMLIWSTSNV